VTSPARTVADCFKHRSRVGLDVAIETLRRLADVLLIPVVRTDRDYSDAQIDGWPMVEDYLETCSGELSLPPDASGPLDAVSPEVVHRLRIQSALCELAGIGQGFREGLTLANAHEHYRVDELSSL
jgi:hypothetical protein